MVELLGHPVLEYDRRPSRIAGPLYTGLLPDCSLVCHGSSFAPLLSLYSFFFLAQLMRVSWVDLPFLPVGMADSSFAKRSIARSKQNENLEVVRQHRARETCINLARRSPDNFRRILAIVSNIIYDLSLFLSGAIERLSWSAIIFLSAHTSRALFGSISHYGQSSSIRREYSCGERFTYFGGHSGHGIVSLF